MKGNGSSEELGKSREKFPRSDLKARPFRLWDAKAESALRWRCYSDPKRAHMGALIEARWSAVGATIEVFNVNNGKLLGQYTRRLHDIHFLGE